MGFDQSERSQGPLCTVIKSGAYVASNTPVASVKVKQEQLQMSIKQQFAPILAPWDALPENSLEET